MDKEILYRKLRRLRTLSALAHDLHPSIADDMAKAHALLSDPSTHLDLLPRESLVEEACSVRFRMGKTSKENRIAFEEFIRNGMKEDRELIKRKLRNLKVETVDDFISAAAALRVMRKILSGIMTELNLKDREDSDGK